MKADTEVSRPRVISPGADGGARERSARARDRPARPGASERGSRTGTDMSTAVNSYRYDIGAIQFDVIIVGAGINGSLPGPGRGVGALSSEA